MEDRTIIKKILIPIFSLILLSNPVFANFGAAEEFAHTSADSSQSYKEDHPGHQETACHHNHHNKSPCSTGSHCCDLERVASDLFGLDSYLLISVETIFHPIEIAKSLFHPPKTHA